MPTLAQSATRILQRCRELALITDIPNQTTRTYLSPAMHRANALVAGWMREAGLTPSQDAAGNLRGLSDPTRPRLLLGSHLDTVRNAGAFDGPLGIVLALEAAQQLLNESPGVPYALEVIAFAEEEGVRFHQPFLGSLALVGGLAPHLALQDDAGVPLQQALPAPDDLDTARLHPSTFAYLEVHIEQGPVLEAESRPLAAVSSIAGQSRLRLTFTGQANHAGTTPMPLRRDALAAAAAFITAAESLARRIPALVATVGSCTVSPGLGNVIPGEATVTLDLRHPDDSTRYTALAQLLAHAQTIADERTIGLIHTTLLDQSAVPMDSALTALLVASAAVAGFDARPIPSGAGHDAMILAPRLPSAMLFVRTPGGISHHPSETVLPDDIEAALSTTLAFLEAVRPASD